MEEGRRLRGQASVEFLIVLGIALLAFTVFFILVQQQGVEANSGVVASQASSLVGDLDSAAKYVYAQGTGASRQVFITIPDGYDPDDSYIANGTIKVSVRGSDYAAGEQFNVSGSLPRFPGFYAIWVVSEPGGVRIGTSMISADKATINVVMVRNDSRSSDLTVYNIWNSSITVSVQYSWTGNLTMFLDTSSSVLPIGGQRTMTAFFSSDSGTPGGFYTGMLNISANDSAGATDSILIPISVEISVDTGIGPPLLVTPSTWNMSLLPNKSASQAFQVCTNVKTYVSAVTFAPSPGAPGAWIGGSEPPLEYISPSSCRTRTLNITVPVNTTSGNYSGFVYLTGESAPDANDAIAIGVAVGGYANDTQGPKADITLFPNNRRIFASDPISARVQGDDRLYGNNTIAGCQVRMDGGVWQNMSPSDGYFNKAVENASYVFFDTGSMGNHTVSGRCYDSRNNTGPEVNATYKSLKAFLFVTKGNSPNGNETAYLNWFGTSVSDQGYLYNYDTMNASAFISPGPANISFYTAIVAEEWTVGMETRMSSFQSSGGSAILLGNSIFGSSVKDLGCSTHQNNILVQETNITIANNTHYITSGLSKVTYQIANGSNIQASFWSDLNGPQLAQSTYDTSKYVLGICTPRIYLWGVVNPVNLNEFGANLTRRMLDNAINASNK